MEDKVERYNKQFSKYPKLVFDKGWLYGVWYCPRPWVKQTYYGEYPLTYLNRVRCLFEENKPLVHLFAGIVKPLEGEVTVDNDPGLNLTYCCEAETLPFKDGEIGCIVADPPYSSEDAKNYSCQEYPNMKKVFMECSRVLKDNGYLAFLYTSLLSVPRKAFLKLRGTIGIVTGTNARIRLLAIYRKEVENVV